MTYRVISPCLDIRTGEELEVGATFPDPTPEQAERLVKAGCLEEVQPPKPPDDNPKPPAAKPKGK